MSILRASRKWWHLQILLVIIPLCVRALVPAAVLSQRRSLYIRQSTSTNENDNIQPEPMDGFENQQDDINATNEKSFPSLSTQQSLPQTLDPFEATGEQELMTTLGGGTALMFEMIRASVAELQSVKPASVQQEGRQQRMSAYDENVLPRWRPYDGVSNANFQFRTAAPDMNNEGFARSIWRNLRKRNKPSLWQNALRIYDRMSELEAVEGSEIRRCNIHFEGAMLACAKLGLWQRALEIYHYVYQTEQEIQQSRYPRAGANASSTQSSSSVIGGKTKQFTKQSPKEKLRMRRDVKISDDMILSLIKACVRASHQRSKFRRQQSLSPKQEEKEAALRRIPLDTALEVLTTMEETHNIPVTAIYVNPLAKAYQSLGYIPQSRMILQTMLSNRTAGEEPESGGDIVNVYDFSAKDKGSYSLLVEGAVVTGEWGAAVQALGEMIDAGLYPNKRHSNIWSEISERQTRPRAQGSWKKKRDDLWTDSVI